MMSSSILPPGFRFHPTDQELIVHYLKKKASSSPDAVVSTIADVDLYKFNPWELPGKAFFGESEWFFFTPRDRKYPNGARPNRAAASGYWKATGTDKPIITSNGSQCLGVKKALVFYRGRPPKGVKTNWMMHEYRLLDDARNSQRLRGSMRVSVKCYWSFLNHLLMDNESRTLCSKGTTNEYDQGLWQPPLENNKQYFRPCLLGILAHNNWSPVLPAFLALSFFLATIVP